MPIITCPVHLTLLAIDLELGLALPNASPIDCPAIFWGLSLCILPIVRVPADSSANVSIAKSSIMYLDIRLTILLLTCALAHHAGYLYQID